MTGPALLDQSEAAAYLNVSLHWLRKKVSAREVPCTRIGKHVRFTEAHLAAIIAAGEQNTTRPNVPVKSKGSARSKL